MEGKRGEREGQEKGRRCEKGSRREGSDQRRIRKGRGRETRPPTN